ncbi:unnamed protein product, partial [Prorocentrum cordatum]
FGSNSGARAGMAYALFCCCAEDADAEQVVVLDPGDEHGGGPSFPSEVVVPQTRDTRGTDTARSSSLADADKVVVLGPGDEHGGGPSSPSEVVVPQTRDTRDPSPLGLASARPRSTFYRKLKAAVTWTRPQDPPAKLALERERARLQELLCSFARRVVAGRPCTYLRARLDGTLERAWAPVEQLEKLKESKSRSAEEARLQVEELERFLPPSARERDHEPGGGPDQERPRASSRTRQTIRQEHQQKELKREEQEVKQLIGRVVTMKRSEATEAMRFLGYEQVPTDVPGIKSYKTRTKQRMFELGRLIIISRKAGKDDPQGFVREISCLKYMMSTCEKLNDQLAELKSKRDRCQEHIRNLSVKLGELQSDYKQSETDLYAWQAAIDELEELEDYMVGEDAPGARGFSTFIPTMQMGVQAIGEMIKVLIKKQQQTDHQMAMLIGHLTATSASASAEEYERAKSEEGAHGHQQPPIEVQASPTSIPAAQPDMPTPVADPGIEPTEVAEASLVDPDRDLLSDAHELGPLLSTVEIEDQRPCYSEEVQGLNCYAVVFGLQRFLIDTEQLVAKALEQDRLRFLVRMFKFAPRCLLTLLDVSLLHRRSWVSALAASFDWLVSFMDPDSVPGTGGLDEWLAALQMDPQRFRATIKTVIRRAREWWSDRHLLHLWDIRVHEALAGTPMDVDAVDVVTSYMCYECGQLFKPPPVRLGVLPAITLYPPKPLGLTLGH